MVCLIPRMEKAVAANPHEYCPAQTSYFPSLYRAATGVQLEYNYARPAFDDSDMTELDFEADETV